MTLLMYAIAELDPRKVSGAGLQGHALRGVGEQRLVAIVSEHEAASSGPAHDQLWRYEQIVEQLMQSGPVLPARFGSVFADESATRSALRSRCEQLSAALERVRGAVELGIRARWRRPQPHTAESPSVRPASGTGYMLGRLAEHRRAHQIQAELAPLRELARADRLRVAPDSTHAVLGAYLVDEHRVGRFARLTQQLDHELSDAELICTGPWPPYSFAGGATT